MKYRIQEFRRKQGDRVYTYHWLGYSYRNEKGTPTFKCLYNLTDLPDDVRRNISNALQNGDKIKVDSHVEFLQATSVGAEAVCWKLAGDLGIMDALSVLSEIDRKVVMAMIIDRIVEPVPHTRKSLFEYLPGSGLERICGLVSESISLDRFYYVLEHLYDIQKYTEKKLFEKRNAGDSRIFLYDITSSYFEGNSCPLAEFGYNRDGKKGKKQIVIGMLTDSRGCPVSVRVFKGNTQDQSTVMERIDEIRREFGVQELVFVGDRGMITKSRRKDLTSEEYSKIKYISALAKKEFVQFLEDDKHPLQLSLFDKSRLVEVEHEGIKYILSFNPEIEEESRQTRLRLIEKTEEKLKCIEKNVNNGKLCKEQVIGKRLYTWLDRWHCAKFFDVEYGEKKFTWKKNEDLIKSYEAMDGFYVLTTDCPELTAEEIRTEYRGLQQVEQVFRTMKTTDLFVRPIHLWTEKRIRGYIFLCMLSYMIIWQARRLLVDFIKPECELRSSLRRVWEKLDKIQVGKISIEGEQHEQLSKIENINQKILDAVSLNQAILKRYLNL